MCTAIGHGTEPFAEVALTRTGNTALALAAAFPAVVRRCEGPFQGAELHMMTSSQVLSVLFSTQYAQVQTSGLVFKDTLKVEAFEDPKVR